MINVSWDDARPTAPGLPDRAASPIACQARQSGNIRAGAGTTTPFHFGARLSTEQANFDGNYSYKRLSRGRVSQQTLPVVPFRPTPLACMTCMQCLGNGVRTRGMKSDGAPMNGSAWEF